MKKIIALVLALMMVLSLGVSAMALELGGLKLVEAPATSTDDKIHFTGDGIINLTPDANGEYFTEAPHGGVAYLAINVDNYKSLTVTSNNDTVKAELMDYDPEKMDAIDNVYYNVARKDKEDCQKYIDEIWALTGDDAVIDPSKEASMTRYEWIKYVVTALNKYNKTTQFYVKSENSVKILKLTLAANYSASFTEANVKLTAVDANNKTLVATLHVVNDVTIFGYEYVKSAAQYKYALELYDAGATGYSDYETYKNGYGTPNTSVIGGPRVVSTTAFRAIEGKDITVDLNKAKVIGEGSIAYKGRVTDTKSSVTIYSVAAGQKGVNFEYYEQATPVKKTDIEAVNGENRKVEFGFYGNQVVNSKFTVNFNLGWTYFELREYFGKKIEEQDIVSFYVLKDGKVLSEFKVDYKDVDLNDVVKLSIDGENSTLGQYAIVVKVPADNKGEKNPNTGAESIMGVVAAVAVVSVAAAAAVSLKK